MTGAETKRWEARLRRAADSLEIARELRDTRVVDAVAAGLSQRAVADAVGLTHGGVQRILARNEVAA
jgi:transposase